MLGLNPQLEQHLYDHGDEPLVEVLVEPKNETQEEEAATTAHHATKDASTDSLLTTLSGSTTWKRNVVSIPSIVFSFFLGALVSNYSSLGKIAWWYQTQEGVLASTVGLLSLSVWKYFDSKSDNRRNCNSRKLSVDSCNIHNLNKQSHECRMHVSVLLGSVGAPPLLSANQHLVSKGMDNSLKLPPYCEEALRDQSEKVIEFARAHINLSLAHDEALGVIRVGTGLRLGLGPSSRCVERVERAALGRDYRRTNESQPNIGSTSVSFQRARALVWRSMTEQRSGLVSLLALVVDDDEEEAECSHETHSMDSVITVTLAGMKTLKIQIGELLSRVLSILTSPSVLQDLGSSPDRTAALQQSTWTAVEAQKHVESAFLLPFNKNRNHAGCTDWNNKNLEKLHAELNAARVSLWAFDNAIHLTEKSNDDDDDMQEWFFRVEQHVRNALNVHHRVGDALFADREGDDQKDQGEEEEGVSTEEKKADSAATDEHPTHFEDAGHVPKVTTPLSSQSDWKHKTAVFLGKGSKSVATTTRTESNYYNTKAVPLDERKHQANLVLEELSSRLKVMELVEEVEVSNQNEEIMQEQVVDGPNHQGSTETISSSSDVFLGASGALLAELKFAIPTNVSE